MENVQYIGENLLPGRIGHFAIILGFFGALLGAFAYFMATHHRHKPQGEGWRNIGRAAFLAHGLSVFGIIGILFFLMLTHQYEYQYVWAHVSDDLDPRYVFAAFWEGQEGSFLLWMFWHVVLGMILMVAAKKWESPTMAVVSLVEAFLGSMLLGLYFGLGDDPVKIGSNPLLLLRDTMDAPIFNNADYLELIKGNGLNPLLQNYWMTIHPPTLFLGFASTTIPFAYAVAGLWTQEHRAWLKPARPWALFSGAILGIGILMGGAWAYEALSFGGYWAWDPVENMSLVPWLTLVAGLHMNQVAVNTGQSIRSTYIFYLITFVFILYSTFLTRSGVLGETSVHAFTEMGLEWQLVAFISAFLLMGAIMMGIRYKEIPTPKKEESIASKEFWMFIGSLVLLFSALIITGSTSLPVYNKIRQFFDPAFEGRVITDPIPHYNKYQIWIAVFIGLLSGFSQYLRFREFNFGKHRRKFLLHSGVALAIAGLLTYLTSLWIDLVSWQYTVLTFAGLFIIVTNLDWLITFTRGNLKTSGSAFSHIGFGLMIIGVIASGLNKRYVSSNPFVMEGLIEGADEESWRKNMMLFRGSPMIMEDYEVTYVGDTIDGFMRRYTVNVKRKNAQGEVTEDFNLHPNVLYDKSYTKIAASNPSTKHYLARDIFTHITALPETEMNFELKKNREDSLDYKTLEASLNQPVEVLDTVWVKNLDTTRIRQYTFTVEAVTFDPSHPDYTPEPGDLAVGINIAVHREDKDSIYRAQPVIVLRQQLLYTYPAQVDPLNTKVRINERFMDYLYTAKQDLDYESFTVSQGKTLEFAGYTIQFSGINRDQLPAKEGEDAEIGVSGMLSVETAERNYVLRPQYIIRGKSLFTPDYYEPDLGLHVRFAQIDPSTGKVTFSFAQEEHTQVAKVPFEYATDSFATNWIVLQAIEFPGINYFWAGTILMMLGMVVSMTYRLRER